MGRCRLEFIWNSEKIAKKFFWEGSIDGKKRQEEELSLEFPLCGKLSISLIQKQVYDYLSLFKSRAKEGQRAEIFILPSVHSLSIEFSSEDTRESRGYEEGGIKPWGNGGEIHQLREYMPGDLVKRIHWKQNARTDQLLVKEFQQEEEESMFLLLDLYDMQEKLFFEGISETERPKEFVLNIHREFYFRENCAFIFSLENFEKELQETKIVIP